MSKGFLFKLVAICVLLIGSVNPMQAGCESRNPASPTGCDGWCWIATGNSCGTVTIAATATWPAYAACSCEPDPAMIIVIPLPGVGGGAAGNIEIAL